MLPVSLGDHGCPSSSMTGTTGRMRSGSTTARPVPSATGVTTFSATHSPQARDSSMP